MKRFARRPSARLKFAFVFLAAGVFGTLTASAPKADAAIGATYTALGDSIAFGAFAPIGQGYVPRYKNFIQSDTGAFVSLVNLGVPGWTSADLRDATHNRPFFRLSLLLSRVVTWNIGGTDLNAARDSYKAGTCGGADNQDCLKAAVAAFQLNWNGILTDLFTLRHGRPTVFRTMTIYYPFVVEDMASDSWPGDGMNDFEALSPYLVAVNNHIKFTSAFAGIPVAPVFESFNGANGDQQPAGLLAFDEFHPNAQGHARIANLLRGLGYATVTP
jgi:lysophospholipase L1-like esterase